MEDPKKQIESETNVKYLTQLSKFIDMDIDNINKDVNKFVDMMFMNEEEYQEKKKKSLEYFEDFKVKVENRLTKLKENENV